jgi:glycosyltransferase involved in cell wall biosynthesis
MHMTKLIPNDSIVFIGTYPPRECGIGTFTTDLLHAFKTITGVSVDYKVAAMNASVEDAYEYPPEVFWQIEQDNKDHYLNLANEINIDTKIKAVVIQHEYGIYGTGSGENLLHFTSSCKKTMTICLHTVLEEMPQEMRVVTQKLLDSVTNVVVLTNTSKEILSRHFPQYQSKITVIEHGIHPTIFTLPDKNKDKHRLKGKTVLTTFGLLSRGKGIEYVIQALPQVVKKHPNLMYLILGQTHPVERRKEGEKYRLELIKLIHDLGLSNHVKFYDKFLDLKDILSYLSATDIYISTSLNPNQAVSGTLSYALGSGRAVVTTDFKQAKEIVDDSVGKIVPCKNSQSYALAILDLLSDEKRLLQKHKNAFEKTRSMLYTNVADNYLTLLGKYANFSKNPVLPSFTLEHLRKMTDDFGLLQFAKYSFPNPDYGYTLDDNARALIVCKYALNQNLSDKVAKKLANKYLRFMFHCLQDNGTLVNYLSYLELNPTEQNVSENIQDSFGRAIWALSEIINSNTLPKAFQAKARVLFSDIATQVKNLDKLHLRSLAFTIKGLHTFDQKYKVEITEFADKLLSSYMKNSQTSWSWYEDKLLYCNGVLPEALLCAYQATNKKEYLTVGLKSLEFLIEKTFMGEVYVAIGQKGWHNREGLRSQFDQQPEDPTSTIQCLTRAYEITKDEKYKYLAFKCFGWFLGNNLLGFRVYNDLTGGCHDALTQEGINLNQGAESLVSYLLGWLEINKLHANN